jgi:hypothetical protein
MSMRVSMVQVGPVRVGMRVWKVPVPVTVAIRGSSAGVRVEMVAIVMSMAVLVLGFFMQMLVLVPVAKHQYQRTAQDYGCGHLQQGKSLSQEDARQHNSEKRAAGKEHLAPGGADILSGGDI